MAVATAALLEEGLGARLPHVVREALIDLGIVCNETVVPISDVRVS